MGGPIAKGAHHSQQDSSKNISLFTSETAALSHEPRDHSVSITLYDEPYCRLFLWAFGNGTKTVSTKAAALLYDSGVLPGWRIFLQPILVRHTVPEQHKANRLYLQAAAKGGHHWPPLCQCFNQTV